MNLRRLKSDILDTSKSNFRFGVIGDCCGFTSQRYVIGVG